MSLPSHQSASLIQQRSTILSAKLEPKLGLWLVRESPFDSISRLAIWSLTIVRFSGSIAVSCSVDTKYLNRLIKAQLAHQSLVSAPRRQSLWSPLRWPAQVVPPQLTTGPSTFLIPTLRGLRPSSMEQETCKAPSKSHRLTEAWTFFVSAKEWISAAKWPMKSYFRTIFKKCVFILQRKSTREICK